MCLAEKDVRLPAYFLWFVFTVRLVLEAVHHCPFFLSQLNNLTVFPTVSIYQPLAATRCAPPGHLEMGHTATCGGADR